MHLGRQRRENGKDQNLKRPGGDRIRKLETRRNIERGRETGEIEERERGEREEK